MIQCRCSGRGRGKVWTGSRRDPCETGALTFMCFSFTAAECNETSLGTLLLQLADFSRCRRQDGSSQLAVVVAKTTLATAHRRGPGGANITWAVTVRGAWEGVRREHHRYRSCSKDTAGHESGSYTRRTAFDRPAECTATLLYLTRHRPADETCRLTRPSSSQNT